MNEYRTKVNENGRLVIPAVFRKALDIKAGDEVIVRMEGDELRIFNVRHALKRARKVIKRYIKTDTNLTQSLINHRRAEASRE